MPRGGKRPGAGRPPGAPAKIAAAKAAIEQHNATLPDSIKPEVARMTPLQVMLRAMVIEANKDDWKAAAVFARDAAPYVHARLSNVEMNATVRRSATDYSDDELAALSGADGEASGEEGTPAPPGRPH